MACKGPQSCRVPSMIPEHFLNEGNWALMHGPYMGCSPELVLANQQDGAPASNRTTGPGSPTWVLQDQFNTAQGAKRRQDSGLR